MSGDLDRSDQLDLDRERRTVDFKFGSIRVTSVGVREFDVRTTYDEALSSALFASRFIDCGKWVLGDVLNFVESRKSRPDDGWNYEQIAAETRRSIGGLMNITSVCRRVPYDVRRPWLSFGVHEAVAKLDRAGQIAMLDRVEAEHLTVEELRGLLRPPEDLTSVVKSPASEAESPKVGVLAPTTPKELTGQSPDSSPPPVETLRDVARAIANTAFPGPGDCICISPDLLARLRRALGEAE